MLVNPRRVRALFRTNEKFPSSRQIRELEKLAGVEVKSWPKRCLANGSGALRQENTARQAAAGSLNRSNVELLNRKRKRGTPESSQVTSKFNDRSTWDNASLGAL